VTVWEADARGLVWEFDARCQSPLPRFDQDLSPLLHLSSTAPLDLTHLAVRSKSHKQAVMQFLDCCFYNTRLIYANEITCPLIHSRCCLCVCQKKRLSTARPSSSWFLLVFLLLLSVSMRVWSIDDPRQNPSEGRISFLKTSFENSSACRPKPSLPCLSS
jgi:hypothetical protein